MKLLMTSRNRPGVIHTQMQYTDVIDFSQISKPGPGRKAYWIDAAIHAREWLAPATAVKIINHVCTFIPSF